MKTYLGFLLASTMQAIGAGFRAYFTFSDGFPPPEIEDLQDSRPSENVSTVSTEDEASATADSSFRPIPLGMHPELIDLTLGAALRKRLHM